MSRKIPALTDFRRIVVKVGSSLLVDSEGGRLHSDWLASLAEDIADLHRGRRDLLVVSSGAIALGRAVLKLPHVLECHLVSGDFDYLVKARISEMASYRKLLGDILLKLPHVRESKSYIVMEEVKESLCLPIPE